MLENRNLKSLVGSNAFGRVLNGYAGVQCLIDAPIANMEVVSAILRAEVGQHRIAVEIILDMFDGAKVVPSPVARTTIARRRFCCLAARSRAKASS